MAGIRDDLLREGPVIVYVLTVFTHRPQGKLIEGRQRKTGKRVSQTGVRGVNRILIVERKKMTIGPHAAPRAEVEEFPLA